MENLFLKAKHWHIFSLTFILPIIISMISFIFFIIKLKNVAEAESTEGMTSFFIQYLKIVFAIIVASYFLISMWYYYVTTHIQELIPSDLSLSLKRFKIVLFAPLLYIAVLSVVFAIKFNDFSTIQSSDVPLYFIFVWAALMLFNLIYFLSNLHSIFFVAKTLKTAELQRQVTFSDFVGEFFLILFLPIGIWMIQPKINKLIQEEPFV